MKTEYTNELIGIESVLCSCVANNECEECCHSIHESLRPYFSADDHHRLRGVYSGTICTSCGRLCYRIFLHTQLYNGPIYRIPVGYKMYPDLSREAMLERKAPKTPREDYDPNYWVNYYRDKDANVPFIPTTKIEKKKREEKIVVNKFLEELRRRKREADSLMLDKS